MAVRLSALRTRRTLLPRNIIFLFLELISVRGRVNARAYRQRTERIHYALYSTCRLAVFSVKHEQTEVRFHHNYLATFWVGTCWGKTNRKTRRDNSDFRTETAERTITSVESPVIKTAWRGFVEIRATNVSSSQHSMTALHQLWHEALNVISGLLRMRSCVSILPSGVQRCLNA
jgi:hypothetical protein